MSHKKTTIRIVLGDVVTNGDLIRLRSTGEVFLYESSKYQVNFCSSVTDVRGNYIGVLNLNDIQIVDKDGNVLNEWLGE